MASIPPKPVKWLLLCSLFILGGWYIWHDLVYTFARDRTQDSFVRNVVLVTHFVCAAPLLLLPPFQFSRRIRAQWPTWHRRVGQLFLSLSLVAASAAILLSTQFDEVGRRPPLFIFAILWFLFSAAAWHCARHRQFAAHAHFVSLSYAVAVGFVLVRLLGDAADMLFPFIDNEEVRGVTREWLCFVIPLVVVESIYSWWPRLKPALSRSGFQQ